MQPGTPEKRFTGDSVLGSVVASVGGQPSARIHRFGDIIADAGWAEFDARLSGPPAGQYVYHVLCLS